MKPSLSAKALKTPSSPPKPRAGQRQSLEQSLLTLDSACMHILDSQFVHDREDMDGLVWQRRFKNIVTPVSLALSECKGPRHFHNHYKHKKDDDSVLTPVLEDPVECLAQVCRSALTQCQNDFAGLQDARMNKNRAMLEQALRAFLAAHSAE